MFWQVIVAVARPIAQVLQWSDWRRWHQTRAREYHYRRRTDVGRATPAAPVAHAPTRKSDTALIDQLWQSLEPLLPPQQRIGRPYAHNRRLVLEAIVYVLQTNCGWHQLPAQFPPWQTVYAQFTQWRTTGIWEKIWNAQGESS